MLRRAAVVPAVACRVDGEYRALLTASGPRFVCKDIGYLMLTGGRTHTTMNHLQCDIQLRGCQLGHLLPEHPKTMRPVAEDIVRNSDVSAWKSALFDGHRSEDGFHVLSVDHEDRSGCPPARRGGRP